MKAIISTQYGSPDVLKLADIAKPTPKENEVLVKVRVATVTPSDSAFRQGKPFIIKLMYGLKKPRLQVPGVEFSGDIEAVGANVTQFKRGDAVYGISPNTFGAHAEYLTLPATGTIIKKSPKMAYEDATGVIDGATTALSFLKNVAKIQRGQTILINGASGAVGAYGVQLAKHFGAIVTGVCSGANVELVKSLGADKVIDYTREDFTKNGVKYDIIFDAVGKSTFGKCKRALKPKGIYMTTVPSLGIVGAILRTSIMGGKKAKFTTAGLKQSQTTLSELTELFDAGAMRAVIDRCYPLEQLSDAHRYVDTGRKKGNVLITVS
ncbi:MAG: NAD(P)-dependent alcohol dehydrogenase [Anaerolineae bacterium]|nr:NAD(P)-dependent alcohol dehydrogenase [Anaerolineae bacterium]